MTSVGVSDSLDKIIKDSKNKTEIKIETFAAMKVAANFSKNIDELDLNTQSVLQLHKKLCNESLNDNDYSSQNQAVQDKIEELF